MIGGFLEWISGLVLTELVIGKERWLRWLGLLGALVVKCRVGSGTRFVVVRGETLSQRSWLAGLGRVQVAQCWSVDGG